MSKIFWLKCPTCAYRFYIIEEHRGHGYLWFCPSCKFEFHEDQSVEDATSALSRQ